MMNTKRLLDVCDFQGGTQPPKDEWVNDPREGYVRMLQIRDYSQGDAKFVQYVKDTKRLHKCTKDDIMLSRYGYIGQAFIGLEGAYNVALVKVVKKEEMHTPYLFYYFQSYYFQHFLLSNVGARATIPGFNKDELENALIRIPEMCEQIEIASKIAKVDELIDLHKQQINILEILVKSRFIELFIQENYPHVEIGSILTQCTSVERIQNTKSEIFVTVGLRGTGARQRIIKDGKWPVPFSGYRVKTGQFIYSRIDARNGAFAILPPELNNAVVSKDFPVFIIDDNQILPCVLLNSVLENGFIKQIQNSSFGATNRQRIKEDVFLKYSIPLAPMDVQKEFENFVEQVDKSKYHGEFTCEMEVAA